MAELNPLVVALGTAGTVITAVSTFLVGQRHGKAEFITAVNKAAEMVITKLEKECTRVEEARMRCETSHDECREELHRQREHINRLMLLTGEAPPYQPSDLRRVGKDK